MAKMKVRYRGLSDRREFTAKQLKEHGIGVSQDLVFEASNHWAMTIDLVEPLEQILRAEKTFTITEVKDDNTLGEEVVTATLADDTAVATTLVDETTGAKTKNKSAGK